MSSHNSFSIIRINKDIKEITENPIEGIGIASIEDDPMRYVINMELITGPYKGYCIQLLLIFSDYYPTRPPKILIYPGQAINSSYHEHIFEDETKDENGMNFKKFCFDLLDNDFMSTKSKEIGWNPSYSISSLLIQVQNYISDPDMNGYIPDKYHIEKLMKSMDYYKRYFIISTEHGKIKKLHTWRDPYPPMYYKKEGKKISNKNIKEEDIELEQIKENLTCFMLKLNYLDDSNILLGYPIIQNKSENGKNKIELYPIPELLSYKGFLTQLSQFDNEDIMINYYFGIPKLKSANNKYYKNWVPIYINKKHYEKNRNTILNTFTKITCDNFGISYTFKPLQIFKVLPSILNSMIMGIYNGNNILSTSFIRCYFQYILLFKKLIQEFEGDYLEYLNSKLTKIKKNNYVVNKRIIPDIGNFLILLNFCSLDTHSGEMKKIYDALYEDSLARQMYWIFYGKENKDKTRKLLLKSKMNKLCFEKYKTERYFKMQKFLQFNEDLRNKGIFYQIIDIVCKDKQFLENIFIGKDKVKEQVIVRMNKNFKNIYNECSDNGKKLLEEIILKNLDFQKYLGERELKQIELSYIHEIDKLIKDKNIKNKDEIVDYIFNTSKGNKLLLITLLSKKQIEEKGFMEKLEKNYGVYLDTDNFINNMNQKLKEIKNYKQLYEFIGTDLGKNKTDYELIIEAYDGAKEKGYIENYKKQSNFNNIQSGFRLTRNFINYNKNYNINNSNINYRFNRNFTNYNTSQRNINSRDNNRNLGSKSKSNRSEHSLSSVKTIINRKESNDNYKNRSRSRSNESDTPRNY